MLIEWITCMFLQVVMNLRPRPKLLDGSPEQHWFTPPNQVIRTGTQYEWFSWKIIEII